ncbi:intraflagellar transport protein 46 homolog isoform X3 [Chiloscyllium punctatum]|uniref:intraflagellar transport protein 46 homolog isoform X3 n=1 Tax=Chiloscyllium punctatum TaxID=137246 RepID=UPI003B63F772
MAESDSEGAKTKLVTNQPYDESLDVNDPEEVASIYTPSPRQPAGLRSNRSQTRLMADNSSDEYEEENSKITSTEVMHTFSTTTKGSAFSTALHQHYTRERYDLKEKKKGSKAMQQGFVENEDEEEDEDSDDTESDDDDEEHGAPPEGAYDPADYEHLPTSNEIKELFQYITRYTPQSIELDHKLKPFIPDFIPSVPRPDGKPDNLGLIPLDEPCAKQSDPTVLSLWLTENSKQHSITQLKVKSLENAEKNPKALDNWMDSISELHHSKPPANIHYTKPMPDIEALMQEWPPEFEELLGKVSLPTADINCELTQYIDMICAILDIPVYKDRIQSLHVLFTLYSEFKNSQHFKALAEGNKVSSCEEPPSHSAEVDTVAFD